MLAHDTFECISFDKKTFVIRNHRWILEHFPICFLGINIVVILNQSNTTQVARRKRALADRVNEHKRSSVVSTKANYKQI